MAEGTEMLDVGPGGLPVPRARADLIGHSDAEAALLGAWRSGRLPHAWLLHGPRGIGKATLAFRFARFVLADGTEGGDLGISSDHPISRRVAASGHSDLMTLERGIDDKGRRRSEIVIDDVRRMNRFVGLTAAEALWRVGIVDGAEEMNRNAANALLKHLEEPPANTLFLLVSHAPARLLPTVRSRCRQLALRPLAREEVRALLRAAPDCADLSDGDIDVLVALAEGSPGRGVSMLEQGGVELYQTLTGLLSGLPSPDVAALHAFGDRLAKKDGADAFRTVSELLLWWLAAAIRGRAAGSRGTGELPGDPSVGERLLAAHPLDQWVEVWENVRRLFAGTEPLNLERKQVFLNAFTLLARAARA